MRRSWFFIVCFMIAGYAGMAQLNPDSLNTGNTTVTSAQLFIQLANAIQPSAFPSSSVSQHQAILDGTGNESTPAVVAGNVASLAGLIKPDMFKTGFNAAGLKANASKVTTAAQAGSLLKTFESGLKPTALSALWKMQKANWVNEVARLK